MGPVIENIMNNDSTDGLEIERLKSKIVELYKNVLQKTLKSADPTLPDDELERLMDRHAIEFAKDSQTIDEELAEVNQLLDSFLKEDNLDPVNPEQAKKAKEGLFANVKTNIPVKDGMVPNKEKLMAILKKRKKNTYGGLL